MIANAVLLTAVSAGLLTAVGGPATAGPGVAAVADSAAPTAGASTGSSDSLLKVLLCALKGGTTASTETTPQTCSV